MHLQSLNSARSIVLAIWRATVVPSNVIGEQTWICISPFHSQKYTETM